MAIDFGSFINGMRMSNQDIMDRQRFEQNQQYIQSQMDTMALARDAEQQRMKMTGMEMDQLPTQYAQANYRFAKENTDPQYQGIFASHGTMATGVNDALDDPNMQALRTKAGLPLETKRMQPEVDNNGRLTGTYSVVDKDGNAVQSGMSPEDATRVGAGLLGTQWAKDQYDIAMMRGMRGGMYTKNGSIDELRDAMNGAKAQLAAAVASKSNPQYLVPGPYKDKVDAAYEAANQQISELGQQLLQTSPTMNKFNGTEGPLGRTAAVSKDRKEKKDAAAAADELQQPDVPNGARGRTRNGTPTVTEKDGTVWTMNMNTGQYYKGTADNVYVDPYRQAKREKLQQQEQAKPAALAGPGKKPAAKPSGAQKSSAPAGHVEGKDGLTVNGIWIPYSGK